MKTCMCFICDDKPKTKTITIEFSKEELIQYYGTIRSDKSVTNEYKLKIADAILNMK